MNTNLIGKYMLPVHDKWHNYDTDYLSVMPFCQSWAASLYSKQSNSVFPVCESTRGLVVKRRTYDH